MMNTSTLPGTNSKNYNGTGNGTGNGTVPITPYSPHQRLRLDQQLPQSSSVGLHGHAHHQGGHVNMNVGSASGSGSGIMNPGNGSGFSPPRMMTLTTGFPPSPVHSAGVGMGMGVGVGTTAMGANGGGGLYRPDHRVFFGAEPVRNPDGKWIEWIYINIEMVSYNVHFHLYIILFNATQRPKFSNGNGVRKGMPHFVCT